MSAAVNQSDASTAETTDLHRVRQESRVAPSAVSITRLAEAVESPSPDVIPVIDGKGVVLPRGDVPGLAAAHLYEAWLQVFCVAAKQPSAELVLLVGAPAPDLACRV